MNPTSTSEDINVMTILPDHSSRTEFIERDRSNSIPDKDIITFKLLVFISIVSFVFLAKVYFVPSIAVQCLNDPVHNFLTFINNEVNHSSGFSKTLQVSSSILMDFSFIIVLGYWALYTKSSRLVLVIMLFYLFRAFNQLLIQMTKPNGFYWDDPGFPSIVVPYGFTSDFFFSGHTGFLTICLFEWRELKKPRMFITTLIILIYMVFVLLVFRTHYSIDIMMGFVCAHYIFNLINQNIYTIDNSITSILKQIHQHFTSKPPKQQITTV